MISPDSYSFSCPVTTTAPKTYMNRPIINNSTARISGSLAIVVTSTFPERLTMSR
jgi:hypothetical protein